MKSGKVTLIQKCSGEQVYVQSATMNIKEIIRVLLKGVPVSDHIVSVNKKRKGPVTAASVSLSVEGLHYSYSFNRDGEAVVIEGFSALSGLGRRGGDDVVTVNGVEMPGGDIIISHRIVTGGLAILIIFEYDEGDEKVVVRFDALKRWI